MERNGILYLSDDRGDLSAELERLYTEAFPASERKRLSMIRRMRRRGAMEVLSVRGGQSEFLALAMTMLCDDLALLDYFAVVPESRGTGVGGQALGLLKERYSGRRFFLEIEDIDFARDDGERLLRRRRKSFYLKNGMKETGIKTVIFGQHMELLSDGCSVSEEEYRRIYRRCAGALTARRIDPRFTV